MKGKLLGKMISLRVALTASLCLLVWSVGHGGAAAPNGNGNGGNGNGGLINNVFLETDIRSALQDVAQQAGVHIITDDSVRGTVSVDLKDVPLEATLKLLLMAGGYAYRKLDATTYLVGLCDPTSATFNLLSTTAVIPLRYIKASAVADLLLSDYYKDYVKVDSKSNMVVVTGSQAIVDRVVADLARIDSPRPQVRIDAVVADVQTDRAREFLSTWHISSGVPNPENTRTLSFQDLTLGYTSLHMREVLLAISALVTKGIASVRAQPSVTTVDGEQAQIFVGREEYFSILSGGNAVYPYFQLQSIKSGITLAVQPRVIGDDLITLQFSPEVSDVIARGGQGLPVVNRRSVITTVRVKDGETVVVGGLASEILRKRRSGVPVLGDLPLIGGLFSSTTSSNDKSEVVVMLTPHIIRGGGLTAVSDEETPATSPQASTQAPAPVNSQAQVAPPLASSASPASTTPQAGTAQAVKPGPQTELAAKPVADAPASAPQLTPEPTTAAAPAPPAASEAAAPQAPKPEPRTEQAAKPVADAPASPSQPSPKPDAAQASAPASAVAPLPPAAEPPAAPVSIPATPPPAGVAQVPGTAGATAPAAPAVAPVAEASPPAGVAKQSGAEPRTAAQAASRAQPPQPPAKVSGGNALGAAAVQAKAPAAAAAAQAAAQSPAPEGALLSPLSGAVVTRGEPLRVAVSVPDGAKVDQFSVYLDGRLRAFFGKVQPPCQVDMATLTLPVGSHRLAAAAKLSDGRELQSQSVTIILSEAKPKETS
jgi:type IV pilus assembly protein PilQ